MINTKVSISRKATKNRGVLLLRGHERGTDFVTTCSRVNPPKITNLATGQPWPVFL